MDSTRNNRFQNIMVRVGITWLGRKLNHMILIKIMYKLDY